MPKVKKNSQILGSRDVPVRWRKPSHLVVPKPTGTGRCIILCEHVSIVFV